MPSGSDIMIEALKREGVKDAFGIPGGAIMPFYDRLKDSGIRHILMRHEQGAAHAADGYARALGRPGLCIATSGPGATNLVTGIATAYMDSSPVVALTGQVPVKLIGKDSFQEIDIVGITNPITKYTFQLKRVSEIPRVVKKAFYIASHGRPGPVLIDFPKDIQLGEVEHVEYPERVWVSGRGVHLPSPDMEAVGTAAIWLMEAEKPIMLVGGGVIHSGASPQVLELVELLNMPVVTTLMGKGAVPENHPLCLGMIGMHGKLRANMALAEADLILAVGTRFSDRSVGPFEDLDSNARIIHVDVDESEIGKNVRCHLPIVADAKKALEALIDAVKTLSPKSRTSWVEKVKELRETALESDDGKGIKPWKVMKIMRRVLPRDAIVTTGVGQNQMWAALHFDVYVPRTFISSGGLGTMGFGFPASIGAKVARPDRTVVCVDGDGSFLMTCQNLATAVVQNIPVTVVILNNRSLGMVRQWQELFFNKRFVAVDLGQTPDFEKLAKAFGAEGVRVGDYEEFREALSKAINSDVPTVIDVPIEPSEKVFPIVPPGGKVSEAITG